MIVHKVIDFTCRGWYEPGWREDEWIEIDGPSPDPSGDVDTRLDLETFVATLPPADAEVARLWLLDGLEPDQIAEQLDKSPNAIYQARGGSCSGCGSGWSHELDRRPVRGVRFTVEARRDDPRGRAARARRAGGATSSRG